MLIEANFGHAVKSNSDIADICSMHPCLLAPHANKPLHLVQHYLARVVIPSSHVFGGFVMALSYRQSASPIAFVDYSRAQSYQTSRSHDFMKIISRVFNQKRYMHLHPMAHNHYLSSSANSTSLNDYNDTMLWLQTSCCLQQILLKRTTICCRYVHGFQSFSSVAH